MIKSILHKGGWQPSEDRFCSFTILRRGKNSIGEKLDIVLKALYENGFDITVCPVGTQRDAQELWHSRAGGMTPCCVQAATARFTTR